VEVFVCGRKIENCSVGLNFRAGRRKTKSGRVLTLVTREVGRPNPIPSSNSSFEFDPNTDPSQDFRAGLRKTKSGRVLTLSLA